MQLNNFSARTIVETKKAELMVDGIKSKYNRFEDAFEGWKWRLSRKPECGVCFADGMWLIKSVDFTGYDVAIPAILICYSFDNEQVTIHGVTIVDNNKQS